MPELPDRDALQEASEVLRRLAAQVEDGTLAAEDEVGQSSAAAWRGASAALAQAAQAAEGLA